MLKVKYYLSIALVCVVFLSLGQPGGYSYGKQLLVDDSEVSGSTDLTDFVMLVNFTDNDLRTTANGGHVESSNGYDIIFTLADCSTQLDHQIEDYDAVTGEYVAWVKIPTLFATANTNIHMYYGNSSVASNPSTTDVWGSDYAAVWHMNQSPAAAAPQVIDYTSNTNDGIANGGMGSSDLVRGKIGDAIDFDGSNDFLDCGADASSNPSGSITVSAWFNSRSASGHIINRGGGWDDPGYSLFHLSNTIRIELQRAGEKDIVDNAISINVWHHAALTYNVGTGAIKCFIDGVQQANTGVHTGPMGMPVENLNIGRKEQDAFYFNGVIDEGRIIHAERSSDWLMTEYNNQNAPNAFYTKSAELSAGDLCTTLPIELIDFSAELMNSNDALIKWTTASETNNSFFTIEKSVDGQNWYEIDRVEGAGNSSATTNYSIVDYGLTDMVTYYRLKQTDFDGTTVTSNFRSLKLNSSQGFEVYPNPTNGIVNITSTSSKILTIYNSQGAIVYQEQLNGQGNVERIDLSPFPKGIYLAKTDTDFKKIVLY